MNAAVDSICLKHLRAFAIVGVHPHERQSAQPLVVDLRLQLDLSKPGTSDRLSDTLDYQEVRNAVFQHLEKAQPALLEKLATQLIQICFELDQRICQISLKIEKPQALENVDAAAVEITRTREMLNWPP